MSFVTRILGCLPLVALLAPSAPAAEVGEITWRGMVPGDKMLETTDPKAGIDEMVKHGLNIIWHFEYSGTYGLTNNWPYLRDIYGYARTKGVRAFIVASTAVWCRNNRPKEVSFQDWPCVKHRESWTDYCYCWSDDQLTADSANRLADHLIGAGAEDAIVLLHPVDTGALRDPENWSKRCARCRARWNDDERWKATVNQNNIYNRVLKKRCPKVSVVAGLYPYKLDAVNTPPEKRDANWQKNFYDFIRHVDEGIDEDMYFSTWTYSEESAKEVRKLVKRHKIKVSDCFPGDCGVFGTYGRRAALVMEKGPGSMFTAYMDCIRTSWETYFFLGEYLRDQTLPGSVPYDGQTYYNPLTDHTGPAECRPVLTKICREFWGENIAGDLEDFLWSGVLPRYIENPGDTVTFWNRWLSFAQYDPTGGSVSTKVIDGAQKVVDDAKFMRDQAQKAEVAAAAIGRALAKLGLDAKSSKKEWAEKVPKTVQRDSLKQRARNCRYWLAAARVQANLREFDEVFGSSNGQDARCPGGCNGQDARCPGGVCNGQDARCPGGCNGQDARCPGVTVGGDPRAPRITDLAAKLAETRRQFEEDFAAAEAWGTPPRREWSLSRKTLEDDLAKAELALRLSSPMDAATAAAMKARTWTLPAEPKPLADYDVNDKRVVTWSGDVVVDAPLDLSSRRLRVLPGAKVTFKGEGRIDLLKGALTAWGATFEADRVLTNAFRIAIDQGTLHLNGCTFRNVRATKNWTHGAVIASQRPECRVENCLFENCSPLVLFKSRRATFLNNRVVGGDGGVGVVESPQMSVRGNRFENVRGRAVGLAGDEVLVAENVFIVPQGCLGVGGSEPGAGNRILGNAFFGPATPVSFKGRPNTPVIIAGNWIDRDNQSTIREQD